MGLTNETVQTGRLRSFYYWARLLIMLVILDDLVFGPIFWVIGLVHPVAAALVAFITYWFGCSWIFNEWLTGHPHRLANWFVGRIDVGRPNREVALREERLIDRFVSVTGGVIGVLLFGSILSSIWLWRRNAFRSQQHARRWSFFMAGTYALEFSFLHGLGGGSGFRALAGGLWDLVT